MAVKPFVIVIEGIDFSGKTTLAHRMQTALIERAYRVKLLHDPKGSKNAQTIWETILGLQAQKADPITLFFLFLAARQELICQEVYGEAVDVIIFDRFIFSTIAYQLTHRFEWWKLFLTMHRVFSGLMPNLCIYCELDFNTFQLRHQKRSKKDLLDQIDKSRFDSIQAAYEKALQLQLCPSLRANSQKDDAFTALMNNTLDYITNCDPSSKHPNA